MTLTGCRISQERCFGAYWTSQQFPSAVRAQATKPLGHAINAKCAFEWTDVCLFRFRRQIFITAFAIRTEFKHGGLLLLRGIIRYIKGQLPVSPSAKDDVIVSRMYQMSMVYRREKSREWITRQKRSLLETVAKTWFLEQSILIEKISNLCLVQVKAVGASLSISQQAKKLILSLRVIATGWMMNSKADMDMIFRLSYGKRLPTNSWRRYAD